MIKNGLSTLLFSKNRVLLKRLELKVGTWWLKVYFRDVEPKKEREKRKREKERYHADWLVLTGLTGTARRHTEPAFESQAWLSVKNTGDILVFNKSL